jgi:hypothetical protein|tara:strand:- start:81 stop:182 length:102 start_codon:yes stop_codon:yes gene_type:complete
MEGKKMEGRKMEGRKMGVESSYEQIPLLHSLFP